MKKKIISILGFFIRNISTVVLLCIIFTAFASAEGNVYTTSEDPLISLSYLDSELIRIKEELKTEMKAEIEETVREEIAKNSVGGGVSTEVVFTTESLKAGQKVIALGSCEFILLTGSLKAVCPTPVQNLTDKTTESSILNDGSIIKNHYIIIPKADGRGFCCTSSGTEVMIKGEYKVIG